MRTGAGEEAATLGFLFGPVLRYALLEEQNKVGESVDGRIRERSIGDIR